MKRVFLFLGINLAMMLTLGLIASVLGVGRYIGHGGLNIQALMGYALVFGMGGSFISLWLSKPLAKWSTGARVVQGNEGQVESFLVGVVEQQSRRLGIKMPEVAIFEDPSMNAFATGATKNSSLVAVSTGLLAGMDRKQVEAVIAHEMHHIHSGDMVTMALLQGVLNTFVIVAARAIAWVADQALGRGDREGPSWRFGLISFVLELVFGLLASLIAAAFSRHREFRADKGGADLTSPQAMASALNALRVSHEGALPAQVAAFGIRSGGGLFAMLSTHPPLEERIERLIGR